LKPTHSSFAVVVDNKDASFFVDRADPRDGEPGGASMNRFVYVIHCERQDSSDARCVPTPIDPQRFLETLHHLPIELLTYLADPAATILVEAVKDDATAIQVVVVTALGEASADAAFVRYIQSCSVGARSARICTGTSAQLVR
jgi:hypothetical protein